MSELKLAAQLYTLRDQMKTPEEIRAGLERVRKIGYTSVQVSGIGKVKPIKPEELHKICESLGITICATHSPFDEILNNTEKVAEDHRIIGCPLVGIGSGGPLVFTDHPKLDNYKKLARQLNEAGEKLHRYGLRFAYHNHNAEFVKLEDGSIGFETLIRETDPSLVGFILDTYWVQAGGANPIDYIRLLKGRIEVIHLKDMALDSKRNPVFSEIGGGNINWKPVLDACSETGVRTAAIEQDVCPRDPFDCLRASYDYLHGKFGLN